MVRQCRQMNSGSGLCDYWNEDDPSDNTQLPSGCDPDTGECNPSNDWNEDCDNFFSTEEELCETCGLSEDECECDSVREICKFCGGVCDDDGACPTCDDPDVCDYCGEPLGFCAVDCESLEEDFEEERITPEI